MSAALVEVTCVGTNGIIKPQFTIALPTAGLRVIENTQDVSGANSTVIVPNAPNGGGYTNYQVTETIDDVIAAANADAVVDLDVVNDLTVQGTATFDTPNVYAGATGLTAHSGGGQGSATAITKEQSNFTTVAAAGDSGVLPTAYLGARFIVKNSGAAAMAVFPATGATIDGLSANASVSIPPNCSMIFTGISATAWETTTEANIGIVMNRTAVAINATATMSDGDMRKGYITSTSAAATAITTRTATQLATELGAGAGSTYQFVINNVSGANTVTLTPGSGVTAASAVTGGTTMTVASGAIGTFILVFVSGTVAEVARIQ